LGIKGPGSGGMTSCKVWAAHDQQPPRQTFRVQHYRARKTEAEE
jgi:hypothetical protein